MVGKDSLGTVQQRTVAALNGTIKINQTPTNGANPLMDSLVFGGAWGNGSGATVKLTYALRSGQDPNNFNGIANGQSWSSDEAVALDKALKAWAAVTNVTFTKTTDSKKADLWYWLGTDKDESFADGTLGWHEIPDGETKVPLYGAFNTEGSSWKDDSLKPGGHAFLIMIHEIGHGLGLSHPHNPGTTFPGVTTEFDDYGDYNLNQGIFTTMSYNDGWQTRFPKHKDINYGSQLTPMALDIAAVQSIYGANMKYHTGGDSYRMPTANKSGTGWSCIWDAGGTDTISAGSTTKASTIDLRAATLVGAGAGGYVSWVGGIVGGFTIANGVVIEKAIGGLGNDRINGNSANNTLTGNSGNDVLQGGAGNDRLDGGKGDDFLSGSSGIDTLYYSSFTSNVSVNLGRNDVQSTGAAGRDRISAVENLITGSGNDTLNGSEGSNRLDGGAGNDKFYGRGGHDVLLGSTGNDAYSGGEGTDTIDFSAFKTSVRVNLANTGFQNTIHAGTDKIISVENLYGGSSNDSLSGNAQLNVLKGGAGSDILNGGLGDDTLVGGSGVDRFDFTTALSDSNIDVITDFGSTDIIRLSAAIFTGLTGPGPLLASQFSLGQAANGITYDAATGALYYDVDSTDAILAQQFATLSNRIALSELDFIII